MKNPLKRQESSTDNKTGFCIPERSLEHALSQARIALAESRGELSNTAAKLDLLMSEHQAQLERTKSRCTRIDRRLRDQIEAGPMTCLSGHPNQLANRVLAGADLESVVAADRQHLEPMYSKYRGENSDFA